MNNPHPIIHPAEKSISTNIASWFRSSHQDQATSPEKRSFINRQSVKAPISEPFIPIFIRNVNFFSSQTNFPLTKQDVTADQENSWPQKQLRRQTFMRP